MLLYIERKLMFSSTKIRNAAPLKTKVESYKTPNIRIICQLDVGIVPSKSYKMKFKEVPKRCAKMIAEDFRHQTSVNTPIDRLRLEDFVVKREKIHGYVQNHV